MTRALLVLILLLVTAPMARAQQLVADLSSHLVAITTGFTGADLVLFGAIDAPGDLVVIVRGPPSEVVIRRKERTVGLWLNRSAVTFKDVPGFYEVASSKPLAEIASAEQRARYGIGTDQLRFETSKKREELFVAPYRAALIAARQQSGLFPAEPRQTQFLGPRLFRTTIAFPANVPTGLYQVEVLLFNNGAVVSAQSTPLVVSRIGFSAEIFSFSQQHAATYAACALAFAVAAGWAAAAAFRKG
ncbi:TIGR02186 family protein [Roseiterribacter gracilis]|uniref:TIGR02186 family protein n=1 Tax=Roseiterribacter gracilis TaxID=2812848 RepID=A0A8S8X927_9PROT|nr:hypothetical protein TMPK1_14710 [Rhodospirillales bacterium TMPK1]